MALPIVSLLSLKPQFGHSSFCHNVSSISTRTYYFSPPKLHWYFWNILSHWFIQFCVFNLIKTHLLLFALKENFFQPWNVVKKE